MSLTYRTIEENDKKEICSWKYKGDYSIYNLPSYDEQKNINRGFCNADYEKNYYVFFDGNKLVSFVNLHEEDNEVFLGIGVNPICLNMGYGKRTIELACQISKKRYGSKPLYLGVRTWNKRAINCYKAVGFEIDGDQFELTTLIGKGVFYRMVRRWF